MKKDNNTVIIPEEIQEKLDEIIKRDPQAVATALVFAMSELLWEKQIDTSSLLQEASKEALSLVDTVHMSQPRTKEVLH